MVLSTVEFAVDLSCNNCVENVRKQLEGVKGIEKINISLENQSVLVQTDLPSFKIQQLIEKTGKHAVLKGYGSENTNLGAAVAQLAGNSGFSWGVLKGVVRFVQSSSDTCVVEGTIDGLTPGPHGLQVHECGDISKGCDSVGAVFKSSSEFHKDLASGSHKRVAGNLGSIKADSAGRAEFRFEDSVLKVWDIIGRSLVVTKKPDDSGSDAAQLDKSSQEKLACAIIARSAGLFENSKQICACDGVSIWDERNKPLVGPGRRTEDAKPESKTNGFGSCSIG